MARLMLDCPVTGKPVFTGEEGDRDDLATLEFSGRRLICPACHETHEFTNDDTYIEE